VRSARSAENGLGLEASAAGSSRTAIPERHEAPELRRPWVALQSLHGADLDDGALQPKARERQLDLAAESVDVDRRAASDGDLRPSRCLLHLVLDHAGAAPERRAKHVRVHSPAVVYEHVVEPALDVGDTPVR
jgi:hypothetical protein